MSLKYLIDGYFLPKNKWIFLVIASTVRNNTKKQINAIQFFKFLNQNKFIKCCILIIHDVVLNNVDSIIRNTCITFFISEYQIQQVSNNQVQLKVPVIEINIIYAGSVNLKWSLWL